MKLLKTLEGTEQEIWDVYGQRMIRTVWVSGRIGWAWYPAEFDDIITKGIISENDIAKLEQRRNEVLSDKEPV